MLSTDEKTTKVWRSELETTLRNMKNDDITISYFEISNAFPGGPHSASFETQRVDWDTLLPWAEDLGWHVQSAPESTHLSQQSTPRIRFTRLHHG